MRKQLISICAIGILVFSAKTAGNALVAEAAGKEEETFTATNEFQMENRVTTQVNIPSDLLILTPEIESFFYGELGGTYDDWAPSRVMTRNFRHIR